MQLTKHTPRKSFLVSNNYRLYSHSALSVTMAFKEDATNCEYLLTCTEEDLKFMLSRIENRKREIKAIQERHIKEGEL